MCIEQNAHFMSYCWAVRSESKYRDYEGEIPSLSKAKGKRVSSYFGGDSGQIKHLQSKRIWIIRILFSGTRGGIRTQLIIQSDIGLFKNNGILTRLTLLGGMDGIDCF